MVKLAPLHKGRKQMSTKITTCINGYIIEYDKATKFGILKIKEIANNFDELIAILAKAYEIKKWEK